MMTTRANKPQAAGSLRTSEFERNLSLTELTPYSRKVMLDGLPYKEIAKIALINDAHFHWVRRYFDEMRTVNIKINANKFCFSTEPCHVASYQCGHRIFRQINGLAVLIRMGLLQIRSLYIEAQCQPRSPRLIMYATRKIASMLDELRFIYINVNQETHYVSMVEDLLKRNRTTLDTFFVRRLSPPTSKFNFACFADFTKFGESSFPIRRSIVKSKNRKEVAAKVETAEVKARDAVENMNQN